MSHSIFRPGFFMENFDGFVGAIAVSGMRAGLNNDTTINLVVSLIQMSGGFRSIMVRLLHGSDFSLKASEDIGRVAAGVLRVSASFTEIRGNILADKETATRQVPTQGAGYHI